MSEQELANTRRVARALVTVGEDLIDERDALLAEVERLRAAALAVLDAWSESWDCSADPGHELMDAPMAALRAALAPAPRERRPDTVARGERG